jgi:hypothetical protein
LNHRTKQQRNSNNTTIAPIEIPAMAVEDMLLLTSVVFCPPRDAVSLGNRVELFPVIELMGPPPTDPFPAMTVLVDAVVDVRVRMVDVDDMTD